MHSPRAADRAELRTLPLAGGIPFISFGVDNVQAEYERPTALGVRFVQGPTTMGQVTTAVLDDTCSNLIVLAAMNPVEPNLEP